MTQFPFSSRSSGTVGSATNSTTTSSATTMTNSNQDTRPTPMNLNSSAGNGGNTPGTSPPSTASYIGNTSLPTLSELGEEDTGKSSPMPATPRRAAVEPSEAHVLVVEDNVPNFVLIARMLAFMGVQRCEWKTSGWQVVQFAETLPRVDLILMDIRLPYDDGYQALQKLRANAKLRDTLVVAVTAEASDEQMRRAKKAGFNGFLGKPLDADRFPQQIKRMLRGEEVWEWK